MREDNAKKLLISLLQQEPTQVQAWLEIVWKEQQKIPENFNWGLLASIAADNAKGDYYISLRRESLNLEWAKVAISVYDFLAETHPKHSFTRDAMFLRAYMISHLGNIPGDPILDGSCIVNWFLNHLKFSQEEALAISSLWKDVLKDNYLELMQNHQNFVAFTDKIRELRQIKNELMVIKLLSQNNQFNLDEETSTWLSIQEQLP